MDKYYRRQFTLYKLGVNINKDVKKMFDTFNEIVPNNLNKKHGMYFNIKGYAYMYNGIILFFYGENHFFVNDEYLWSKINDDYIISKTVIAIMLENYFKIDIEYIDSRINSSFDYIIYL